MARPLATLHSLACLVLFVSGALSSSLEIQTTSGIFKGATSSGVDSWLGIPFAQPPVGDLRFKAPRPIVSASGDVKNATAFGNACPQVPSDSLGAPISEDCLYLNVSFTM